MNSDYRPTARVAVSMPPPKKRHWFRCFAIPIVVVGFVLGAAIMSWRIAYNTGGVWMKANLT